MGVMITSDPDVVRAALDAGINYFDTARAYMWGRNEKVLGRGIKGRRQEAIVATKCHQLGSKGKVLASVEKSLRELEIDVIDILQLHGLTRRRQVLLEDHLEAMETLKKEGKIRFAGVTTHQGMIEVMDAAVEAGIYDTVLTVFNFQSPPEVTRAIERTAAAGVGVIAMKVMTGGYTMEAPSGLNPYQAALRWVLGHRSVATTIPSMTTIEQLREDAAVMGTTASWRDDLSLTLYAAVVGGKYCRACGSCQSKCPQGLDLPTIMRAAMYADGYRNESLARQTLAGIEIPCTGCAVCRVSCRFGLHLPERTAIARRFIGDTRA